MTTQGTYRIDPSEPGADLKMMKAPDLWPLGPVLALAKEDLRLGVGADPQQGVGFMVNIPGVPRTRVYLLNLHDIRVADVLKGDDEARERIPSEDYDDFEGVYDAGWRVN